MEVREQQPKPTLARMMGEVTHVSPLLRKVCELSGCSEERVGEWLLKCAVERGASHYRRTFDPTLPPDSPQLTSEEVGVALCLYHHPFNPMLIRAAAQLLSAADTDAESLVFLGAQERCEPVLLHIAKAAEALASTQNPWPFVLKNLSTRRGAQTDSLPHWSRFVSQTGCTPSGRGMHVEWLTRDEQPARDSHDS
jgi:hypothetical protein